MKFTLLMKRHLWIPTFLFVSVFCSLIAKAQTQGYINWPETWRQWNELQHLNQQWWNRLSPREQYIVRAVDTVEQAYVKQNGTTCIPVNQQNLNVMMNYIGAGASEENFVLGRMQKFCQVGNVLQQSENTINEIERQMQCGFRPECYL